MPRRASTALSCSASMRMMSLRWRKRIVGRTRDGDEVGPQRVCASRTECGVEPVLGGMPDRQASLALGASGRGQSECGVRGGSRASGSTMTKPSRSRGRRLWPSVVRSSARASARSQTVGGRTPSRFARRAQQCELRDGEALGCQGGIVGLRQAPRRHSQRRAATIDSRHHHLRYKVHMHAFARPVNQSTSQAVPRYSWHIQHVRTKVAG